MFGCFGRILSGIALIVIGAVGWHFRDMWWPKAKEVVSARLPDDTAEGWTPVSRTGAQRSLARIQELNSSTGPAYINISASEFAAYVLGSTLTQLAEADAAPEALADQDKLWLRARVPLSEFGGRDALGPLASMFSDTERLTIAGRLESVRPGLAQFKLTDVAVRDLKIPQAAITRLVRSWGPSQRPDGVDSDALPVELPNYVGDLRLSRGRVTLYKTTP